MEIIKVIELPPNKNFEVEKKIYFAKLAEAQKVNLPPELEKYKHTIPWPINPNQLGTYLGPYFGDKTYYLTINGDSYDKNRDIHDGIDVQTQAGTLIRVPEESRLFSVWIKDNKPKMNGYDVEVHLQGVKTGIIYIFAHLSSENLSEKCKDFNIYVNQQMALLSKKKLLFNGEEKVFFRRYES